MSREADSCTYQTGGGDSIVVFSINPDDGSLTPVEWVPSGGKTPRNFAIDPTGKWLFAANQGSNDIKLFQADLPSALRGIREDVLHLAGGIDHEEKERQRSAAEFVSRLGPVRLESADVRREGLAPRGGGGIHRPAAWLVPSVQTFIVGHDGLVYH